MKKASFRVKYILSSASLLLGGGLFLFLDRFGVFDYILVCPLHLLGIYCPTCGLTRAAHALLSLDPLRALGYHPLLPLFLAVFLYYGGVGLFAAVRNDGTILRRAPRWPAVLLIAALLVFFLVRNILLFCGIDPVGDFL